MLRCCLRAHEKGSWVVVPFVVVVLTQGNYKCKTSSWEMDVTQDIQVRWIGSRQHDNATKKCKRQNALLYIPRQWPEGTWSRNQDRAEQIDAWSVPGWEPLLASSCVPIMEEEGNKTKNIPQLLCIGCVFSLSFSSRAMGTLLKRSNPNRAHNLWKQAVIPLYSPQTGSCRHSLSSV